MTALKSAAVAEVEKVQEEMLPELIDFIGYLNFKSARALREKPKRQLGTLEGKIKIADDFDEPLEDFKEYM